MIDLYKCTFCGQPIFIDSNMYYIDCPSCNNEIIFNNIGFHMPSLTKSERELYLGLRFLDSEDEFLACHNCQFPLVKGYCRSCDEFYYTCKCRSFLDSEHVSCRTYQEESELITLRQLVHYD